jgi:hypothetical protein
MVYRAWYGFSTTSSWISWLIRKRTRSNVSHCWVQVENRETGDELYEGIWSGFHMQLFERFAVDGNSIRYKHEVSLTREQYVLLKSWCGRRYDYRRVLWFAVKLVFPWISARETSRVMTCSEAISRLDPGRFAGVRAETSTPSSLMRILRTSKE